MTTYYMTRAAGGNLPVRSAEEIRKAFDVPVVMSDVYLKSQYETDPRKQGGKKYPPQYRTIVDRNGNRTKELIDPSKPVIFDDTKGGYEERERQALETSMRNNAAPKEEMGPIMYIFFGLLAIYLLK